MYLSLSPHLITVMKVKVRSSPSASAFAKWGTAKAGSWDPSNASDPVPAIPSCPQAFLSSQGKLVSCSKDGYVKVWDLETQHCCQTITGFKAEVWSLDIDPTDTRVVVGSTDQELRMYLVLGPRSAHTLSETAAAPLEGGKAAASGVAATVATAGIAALAAPVLQAMGSVKRIGQDRVVSLRYTANGQMLACQGTGKTVELFRCVCVCVGEGGGGAYGSGCD